jgi:peptidoglycan/LPS O-acetylase OafA/YrhL
MREPQSRIDCIDILRGLAALAVALFHFNEPFPPLADAYHRALRWLGVPVFFVVSGYCVASARSKSAFLVFIQRRLVRIFPPYWASLGFVAAVIALRLATHGVNDITPLPKDFSSVVHTAFALVSPVTATPGMNWVYWSLTYELAFYLGLGALGGRAARLGLPLFSAAAAFIPGFPCSHWGLFGLGVAMFQAAHGARSRAALLAALCTAGNFLQLGPIQASIGLLTAFLIGFPPAFLSHRALRPLRASGIFSYSLYLVHVPVGCYLVPYYLTGSLSRELGPSLLQDAVALVCSLGVALGFYWLFERPSHAWARKIGSAYGSPPPTS